MSGKEVAKGMAQAAIMADERNPAAVYSGAEKRLRKIAGMPKKTTAAKASKAATAKSKAKSEAKKKPKSHTPRKRKERMEYKAPSTTDEMRKRRATKARNDSPVKEILDVKDKFKAKASKVNSLLKAFGLGK